MTESPEQSHSTRARSGPGLGAYGPALWAAAVFLGALYFYLLTTQFHFAARPGRLGPAFWPQVILIMMMITAAIDCFVEARKARAQTLTPAGSKTAEAAPRVWWLMALGLVIILAYVNLSTVLGFTLANFLFMVAFMWLSGFTRPVLVPIISALGTIILMVLFVRIVYVSLPIGIGPFENLTLLIYSLLGIS